MVAVGAGAGLLILSLLATIVTVVGVSGSGPGRSGGGRQDRAEAAATRLESAATRLSGSPATRYRGTISGGPGSATEVELSVTGKGSTHGTLKQNGHELQILAVDGKTFFKGDKDFWKSGGAPAKTLDQYAKQWVKVPPEKLGIDIQALLAPAKLGHELGRAATAGTVTPGPETTVGGVKVRAVTTPEWKVYVTTATPRRIVRIERSGTSGDYGGTPRSPGIPRAAGPEAPTVRTAAFAHGGRTESRQREAGLRLDLSGLTEQEVDDLYERLLDKVRKLEDSIDSQVRFALDGSITLSPCGPSGCTARVTLRNSVRPGSPYLKADKPVHAAITINMTLDGRPVRTCTVTKSMQPNDTVSTTCHASYYIPPSRNPRRHYVRAQSHAVARTLVEADIKRIVSDLKKEQKEQKEQETGRKPRRVDCVAGNSFAPGTPVLMADGTHTPIEDIETGDRVMAMAPGRERPGPRPVTDTITGSGAKRLIKIMVESAGPRGPPLTATAGHPFWVVGEQAFVDAADLRPGDRLITAAGRSVAVRETTAVTRTARVHNLTVGTFHTYFVTAGGHDVLVHNANRPLRCQTPDEIDRKIEENAKAKAKPRDKSPEERKRAEEEAAAKRLEAKVGRRLRECVTQFNLEFPAAGGHKSGEIDVGTKGAIVEVYNGTKGDLDGKAKQVSKYRGHPLANPGGKRRLLFLAPNVSIADRKAFAKANGVQVFGSIDHLKNHLRRHGLC